MQVIKPFDINDSNMTSTILEPDTSQGEVEWIENRPNFITMPNATYGIATIDDKQFVVGSDGAAGVNVYVYQDGGLIDSWATPNSTIKGIASDGTDLFLLGNPSLSTTTATIYKHQQDGSAITSFVITPSQAYDQNVGVICHRAGALFVHSKVAATHSTITAYSDSTGANLGEYDVSALSYNIVGLSSDDSAFYLNALDVVVTTLYKSDLSFSSFDSLFETRISNLVTADASFDGTVFWFILGGIPYGFGYLSSDGKGLGVYLTGEQAIKVSTHKIYQAATNTTDDPEVGVNLKPPSWEIVSATNKYRAFDYVKSVQATSTSPLVYTFTPNQLHSAIAAFNIDGVASINITVVDPDEGEVYNEDITMIDYSGIINAWQYYFYQLSYIDRFVIDDLPPYKNATITVTLTSVTDINVGEIALGRGRRIGVLVKGTSTDRKSYSTIETDSFGNETVTKRPSATHTNFAVSLPTNTSAYVERTLKDSLDVPTLFIGEDVDGAKLIDLGYYERSPLVRANQSLSQINLKVRGLV